MNITIDYEYNEKFLPNAKCRKERSRPVKGSAAIEIHEIEEKEFPIAFKVTEYKSIYENANNYSDFSEDKYKGYLPHTEEIRTDGIYLYAPLRITHGAALSTEFEPVSTLKDTLERYSRQSLSYVDDSVQYTDKSVKVSDNSAEKVERLKNKADEYVIFNGIIWCRTGEPYYYTNTFGFGHNHGGTGLFIGKHRGEPTNGFSALEREKAIIYGRTVASNRGDTESVDAIGKDVNIEVLMPEMIKFTSL